MNNPNLDLAPIIPGFRRALNAFLFDLRSLCPRVEGGFKLGFSDQFQGMTLLITIAEEFKVKEYDPFGVASRSAWVRTASRIRPIPACMYEALDEYYGDRAEQMGRMFKAYVNLKAGE